MRPLKEREKKVLGELSRFIRERGYAPSQRELAKMVGVKSPNTIDYYLEKLESKGWLRCHKNRFRAVELAGSGTGIPILGSVPAGPPNLAAEDREEWSGVDPSWAIPGGAGTFALRVKGDSMKDAGILDGDIAVVRVQATAENGAVVVARAGDETTVKFLKRREDGVWLVPANPRYKPIQLRKGEDGDGAGIAGRVIAVIRRL